MGENVMWITEPVCENRCLIICELVDDVEVSYASCQNILMQNLNMQQILFAYITSSISEEITAGKYV
jgi:hypothetical protein